MNEPSARQGVGRPVALFHLRRLVPPREIPAPFGHGTGRDKPCPYNLAASAALSRTILVAKSSIVEKIAGAGLVPARPAPSGAGNNPLRSIIFSSRMD